MNNNRRSFIKKLGIATAALAVNPLDLMAAELPENNIVTNKPIVLSTWNFGIKANEEAWTILGKGGKALDAVEKGVRLVELDPKERSVGYGGRPDRDGRVTLDACIMDENYNIGSVACLEHIKNPDFRSQSCNGKNTSRNAGRRRSITVCPFTGF
jgi:N4-(beta-N-acetylglucosaminyl)-L-asparaginase